MGKPWRTLSDELAELERTNPEVKEAAENYDRTVRQILRRARAEREATEVSTARDGDPSGRTNAGGES
jgi:hypothetical protein